MRDKIAYWWQHNGSKYTFWHWVYTVFIGPLIIFYYLLSIIGKFIERALLYVQDRLPPLRK